MARVAQLVGGEARTWAQASQLPCSFPNRISAHVHSTERSPPYPSRYLLSTHLELPPASCKTESTPTISSVPTVSFSSRARGSRASPDRMEWPRPRAGLFCFLRSRFLGSQNRVLQRVRTPCLPSGGFGVRPSRWQRRG